MGAGLANNLIYPTARNKEVYGVYLYICAKLQAWVKIRLEQDDYRQFDGMVEM